MTKIVYVEEGQSLEIRTVRAGFDFSTDFAGWNEQTRPPKVYMRVHSPTHVEFYDPEIRITQVGVTSND